jgi:hypothetical protein
LTKLGLGEQDVGCLRSNDEMPSTQEWLGRKNVQSQKDPHPALPCPGITTLRNNSKPEVGK